MDGPARAAIQHLADKQKAYQGALGVYLGFKRDVQEGRLSSEVLEEWSKVEEAASEVADARQEYEEILAKE
jgi:molybdopterin synthase catalytic subunit